jgi:hypothetical protein
MCTCTYVPLLTCPSPGVCVCMHARAQDGRTPLWSAAYCGNAGVVPLLLKAGASVDMANNVSWMPCVADGALLCVCVCVCVCAHTASQPAAAAAAPVASAARGPAAGQPAARHSFEMVLPVEDATMFAYGGPGGSGSPSDMFGCGDVGDIEEADVARWRAEDAKAGVSLPVRLAKNVVYFLHEETGRRGPEGGGVVSASFINARAAAGPLGVAPRWGGVLRVLVTVASAAVADTVVRGRHALRLNGLTSGVYDVLSDSEEAQHRALWPAFRAAKAAGKRPQFHRAPRDLRRAGGRTCSLVAHPPWGCVEGRRRYTRAEAAAE